MKKKEVIEMTRLSFAYPIELKIRLQAIADKEERSLTSIVIRMLKSQLELVEEPKTAAKRFLRSQGK